MITRRKCLARPLSAPGAASLGPYRDPLTAPSPPTTCAAEPPSSTAAKQPSRPTASPPEQPSSRAAPSAEQPELPEPLSSRATNAAGAARAARTARAARAARAAELPYSSIASTPAGVPRPYLLSLCDRAHGLSLFDLTSGVSPAPPATADSTVRSQWGTRNAAARLAVRRHLPTTERAHFSQYRSAQTLYDAVVARYSSPATAGLSRFFLRYLFPDLAAFPTVADLIKHLRTSDTRYRAALPAEFCAMNPPPLYLTLYYVVTRLPDSLRVVRDHFLSVCPTTLTVDLLEERPSQVPCLESSFASRHRSQ
ncbi:unnamed protein product [Closterium sp. NIES-54]